MAPKHVDSASHRLKVFIVSARPEATQVVKLKSWWNRSNKMLIRDDMRLTRRFPDLNIPVAVFVEIACPEPAAIIKNNYSPQKTFYYGDRRFTNILTFRHVCLSIQVQC